MSTFYNTLTPKNKANFDIELEKPINIDLSKGYYLYGSQGIGKTVNALQIAKMILRKQAIDPDYETNHIRFYNWLNIIDIARKTNQEGEGGWQQRQDLETIKNIDCLIIDDLGTGRHNDYIDETLYSLINYRYEYLKQTIITSNYSLADLSESYSPRIASRIVGMCQLLKLKNNKDLRIIT